MNIEITPKKTDGLERLIEVRVPIETVRDAEDRRRDDTRRARGSPGFRPGKAPPAMIKKRFKDAIRQQVIETLVQEAFQEVIDREKFKVASQPHVHDLKFEEGQPLSFELHVEVRPEIELARTQGFRVTRTRRRSPTRAVREQIEQIREQKAHVDAGRGQARARRHGARASSARPTKTASSPSRASTRWCSAAGRRSPASKS